jgi:polyphosphate kinase 2 (PPK2 family)
MLDEINLSQTLKKKAYKPIRKAQIERIFDLSELVYEQKRPVIIVFEGWDAAGKGTTIRQLTAPLDARGFKVLATQAPRTHEKRKPWLWRFWMNLPRYGQIAIFDHSWYGRVLVERVAGLTPMPQWIAAYEEINNFERTLAGDGAIFIKFWLHISKNEQLRRFMQLATEPENAWRVTAEDWENYRKYDEYLAAVRDMLNKTSTAIAPWTVVPATDSEVRLFRVFDTIVKRLEMALGLSTTTWPTLDELSKDDESEDKPHDKARKKDKEDKKKQAVKPDAETPPHADEATPQKTKGAKHKVKHDVGDGASSEAAASAVVVTDKPATGTALAMEAPNA